MHTSQSFLFHRPLVSLWHRHQAEPRSVHPNGGSRDGRHGEDGDHRLVLGRLYTHPPPCAGVGAWTHWTLAARSGPLGKVRRGCAGGSIRFSGQGICECGVRGRDEDHSRVVFAVWVTDKIFGYFKEKGNGTDCIVSRVLNRLQGEEEEVRKHKLGVLKNILGVVYAGMVKRKVLLHSINPRCFYSWVRHSK